MNWMPLVTFGAYAGLSLLSLLLWWVIYDLVLTPGIPVREAIFGRQPNPAVALDVFGGFLALGLLNASVIGAPPLQTFALDLEATALTLGGSIALLALLRLATGGFLRLWFGQRRDAHGQLVTFNNELFRQRNLATGLFSTALYLILVAGLVEEDLLNIDGYRVAATFNMLGVWLLGAALVVLHSWLFLGIGTRHHILHESFHQNHPAAPTSLLGLVAGTLLLNHALLAELAWDQHMFTQPWLWAFLLLALVFVVVVRGVLYVAFRLTLGVDIRAELVRANAAWGIIDGGLIFTLLLIQTALLG